MKPTYKANDGSEHDTAKAAAAHNKLLDAQRAFSESAREVARCLGAAALTADGRPFNTERSRDYWHVARRWDGGLPRLVRVNIWPHNATFDNDREGPLLVRWYEERNGRGDYTSLPICELYSDEAKATAAWLDACRQTVAEMTAELADLEVKHGERT